MTSGFLHHDWPTIITDVVDFVALQPMASSCRLVRGGKRYHFTMYDFEAKPMAQFIANNIKQARQIFSMLPGVVTSQKMPELWT